VARRKKEMTSIDPAWYSSGAMVRDSPPRGRRGLLSQTIHEEIDSDY